MSLEYNLYFLTLLIILITIAITIGQTLYKIRKSRIECTTCNKKRGINAIISLSAVYIVYVLFMNINYTKIYEYATDNVNVDGYFVEVKEGDNKEEFKIKFYKNEEIVEKVLKKSEVEIVESPDVNYIEFREREFIKEKDFLGKKTIISTTFKEDAPMIYTDSKVILDRG